jgi:hypothetical protein
LIPRNNEPRIARIDADLLCFSSVSICVSSVAVFLGSGYADPCPPRSSAAFRFAETGEATIDGMWHEHRSNPFAPRRGEATVEQPFRLSLAHLLLWTMTTAVALFLLRPTVPTDKKPFDAAEESANAAALVPAVVTVAVAPVYGVAILAVAMALWVPLTCQGTLTVRQPGHWLLLIVGAQFLGVALYAWGIRFLQVGPPLPARHSIPGGFAIAAGIGFLLFMVLLLFLAATEAQVPLRWKVSFRLFAAAYLTSSLCCCIMPLHPSPLPLVPATMLLAFLAATLIAAIIDMARGERRDLPHWLGVVAAWSMVMHVVVLTGAWRMI